MLNEEALVEKYGEVCKKATAARILDRTPHTINSMLRDGRLNDACAGTMVDVRSIARYIAAPKHENFEAKKRKLIERTGCNWVV